MYDRRATKRGRKGSRSGCNNNGASRSKTASKNVGSWEQHTYFGRASQQLSRDGHEITNESLSRATRRRSCSLLLVEEERSSAS